jgi:hypothetical protein
MGAVDGNRGRIQQRLGQIDGPRVAVARAHAGQRDLPDIASPFQLMLARLEQQEEPGCVARDDAEGRPAVRGPGRERRECHAVYSRSGGVCFSIHLSKSPS